MFNGKTTQLALSVILIAILIADIAAYIIPNAGFAGLIIWSLSSLAFVSFSLYCLIQILKEFFSGNWLFTPMIMLVHFTIILINAGFPQNLSGETTQEINCLLGLLNGEAGYAFTKTCLFEYPARQFYLPALPTLLFGRSLLSLQIGGALWFIICLPIFIFGFNRYFSKYKYADILCALNLSLLFHFSKFNHFIFAYEQSIFPFCFCLAAVGVFLLFLKKENTESLLMLTLITVHAVFSYTPSLSLVAAVLCLFLWLILKKKEYRKLAGLLILLIAVETGISFLMRADLRISGNERSINELIADVTGGFYNIIFKTEGDALASDYVNYFVIAVIFAGLSGYLSLAGMFISVWILTTILAALYMRGYSYYGIDFRLHRATVILPSVFILSSLFITKIFKDYKYTFVVLIPLLIYSTYTGFYYQKEKLSYKNVSPHYEFIKLLSGKVNSGNNYNIVMSKNAADMYGSLRDTMQYFLPDISVEYETEDCSVLAQSFRKRKNTILLKNKKEDPANCRPPYESASESFQIKTVDNQFVAYLFSPSSFRKPGS